MTPADFHDPALAGRLLSSIRSRNPGRTIRLMHVCGTHENALCQFGLREVLPPWLRLVAGPGCPVCVCPAADIDLAVRLSLLPSVTLAAFGDVVRVPARQSLQEAKALGADVRVVYGIEDAIAIAAARTDRQVVFFAVGFETTSCTTAAALRRDLPSNFSIVCSHRIVPPALDALIASEGPMLDGFVLPGHVMTIAGLGEYTPLSDRTGIPMAVAGFEPVDLLLALDDLVGRVLERRAGVFNGYPRLVRESGNVAAQRVMAEVFELVDAAWRGIGTIPGSGYRLRGEFRRFDACDRFGICPDPDLPDTEPGCRCGEVLLGRIEPEDCPLFGTACHPDHPVGPCMVAFEGTCHARVRRGAG